MPKLHRDFRPLVRELEALGFVVEPGGKHYLIKRISNGKTVGSLPRTPSDRRNILNTRSDLRRAGILPRAA